MITDDYLNTSRVVQGLKDGPFGKYTHLLIEELRRGRYSLATSHQYLSLAHAFGFWLSASGPVVADVQEALVAQYLAERWRHHPRRFGDCSALALLLSVLRAAGIITPRQLPTRDPREQLLEAYTLYMDRKRGLAPSSIAGHVWFLRPFLRELGVATNADLARLSAPKVASYIEHHVGDHGPTTARIMCTRVRVFLRYLHVEGFIPADLTGAIPKIRRPSEARLPSFMPLDDVRRVLDGCDRDTAVGQRDYAILMLMACLGLRACEVARLTLDDFDWRAGQFTVHGKGRKTAIMPLPPDVGAAIASYLQHGRPRSDSRRMFLIARAPYTPVARSQCIQTVARSAIRRAGIVDLAHRGSHTFRHSLATGLLRSGASLTEIGQLLRHEEQDTTRIYAKVDLDSLRPLGQPWLGGEQ